MSFDFTSYKHLVEFLGQSLGDNTEIVLYDFSNINESVIAVYNGHISGISIGDPLTGFALTKLKDKGKDTPPYYINYLTHSKSGKPLRSSCFFILNHKGIPEGLINISMDVSKYQEAANLLSQLGFIPNQQDGSDEADKINSYHEIIPQTPEDLIRQLIDEVTNTKGFPIDRLTTDEKMKVFQKLNDENFFLLKGAISQAAASLNISEATAYRYLSKIKKNKQDR